MKYKVKYQVAETFYSLKGEGRWTGYPAFFIRLSGCNLHCDFCDTNYVTTKEATAAELLKETLRHPTRIVVITGGEPTLQDIYPLVTILKLNGYQVHLETNGTILTNLGWDWIAISPKSPIETLDSLTMKAGNEYKFLVGLPNWRQYIKSVVGRFDLTGKTKWIMPLAKPYPFKLQDGLIDENIKEAMKYCLEHPAFSYCMQLHKTLGIK